MCGEAKREVLGRHVFKGYGDKKPYYGDGTFAVGEVYNRIGNIDTYEGFGLEPDALFIDDNGARVYEEMQFFEDAE